MLRGRAGIVWCQLWAAARPRRCAASACLGRHPPDTMEAMDRRHRDTPNPSTPAGPERRHDAPVGTPGRPRAKATAQAPPGPAASGQDRGTRATRRRDQRPRATKAGPPRPRPPGRPSRTPPRDVPARPPALGGRSRNRALYNRRVQRANERWPVAARVAASVFSASRLVLGCSARPSRSRSTAGCSIGASRPSRAGRGSGRAPGLRTPADPVAMRSQLTRTAGWPCRSGPTSMSSGRVIPDPGRSPDIPVRIYRQFGTGMGGGPGAAAGHRLLPRRRLGDRRPRLPRRLVPAAGRGQRVHRGGGRLPAGPRGPVPGRGRRRAGRLRLGAAHSDEVGHRRRSGRGDGRQRRRQSGRGGGPGDPAGATEPDRTCPPPVAQGLVYPVLRCPPRLGVDADRWPRASSSPSEHGVLPEPAICPTGRLWRPRGLPAAGRRPARSGAGAGGHGGLRPASGRRGRLRRSPASRPGSRSTTAATTTRCTGSWAWASLPDSLALATEVCDAMGRMMRRSADAGTERRGPLGADVLALRPPDRPLQLRHGLHPRDAGSGRRRRMAAGCSFDAEFLAASGSDEVLVLPTAAAYEHPERLVVGAGEWFEPARWPGGGSDGAVPGRRRGRRRGRRHAGEPGSSI